jgi:hypothetical protein
MTKLIVIFIVIVCLFGGWQLFLYWDKINHEEEVAKKQTQATTITAGNQLGGLSQPMEKSLDLAQKQGAAGLRNWLKTYGQSVKDPRKAWIELDYCVLVAHEDPSEARRVFAGVKSRLPESSPVYPRVKQLQSTYE